MAVCVAEGWPPLMLPASLSVIANVALRAVMGVGSFMFGVNVTVIEQFRLTSRNSGNNGQLLPVMAKSSGFAPLNWKAVTLSAKNSCPFPILENRMVCGALVVPTCWSLNSSGGLVRRTVGVVPWPKRFSETEPILVGKTRVPLRSPNCVGLKLTVKLQDSLGFFVVLEQFSVTMANSEVDEVTVPLILRSELPVLVSVPESCGGATAPTAGALMSC